MECRGGVQINHRIFPFHRKLFPNKTTEWRFEPPYFGTEGLQIESRSYPHICSEEYSKYDRKYVVKNIQKSLIHLQQKVKERPLKRLIYTSNN